MTKPIPNFCEKGWYLLYENDLYYDPERKGYVAVKLIEPLSRADAETKKRLVRYWFAKVHVFRNTGTGMEGCEVRIFNSHPVERRWGPIGDRDIWATAARFGDSWRIVKNQNSCRYGYHLLEHKKGIAGIEFYVYDSLIETFKKD